MVEVGIGDATLVLADPYPPTPSTGAPHKRSAAPSAAAETLRLSWCLRLSFGSRIASIWARDWSLLLEAVCTCPLGALMQAGRRWSWSTWVCQVLGVVKS